VYRFLGNIRAFARHIRNHHTVTTCTKLTFKTPYSAIEGDLLDGACYELMEHGALGTTVEMPPLLSCFVESNELTVENFIQFAKDLGLTLQDRQEVTQQNWSEQCPELWLPIQAGDIKILPVQSPADTQAVSPDTLKIIPGLGFGTGHHPTTRMILTVLSQLKTAGNFTPTSALDIGTGSGILAIAATRLFNIEVQAFDIDPAALLNARDNCELNSTLDTVHLSTTPIEEMRGEYDLIIGNLYGEVLIQMAPEVSRLAARKCTVVLSGITDLVRNLVVEAYTQGDRWTIIEEYVEDSWVCLVLRSE
jgi:ribosomal protein L11 methyltransferase